MENKKKQKLLSFMIQSLASFYCHKKKMLIACNLLV